MTIISVNLTNDFGGNQLNYHYDYVPEFLNVHINESKKKIYFI